MKSKLSVLIQVIFLTTVVFNAIPLVASTDVIRVPEDYPLIQWAINAANSGDTILVSGYQYERVNVNKTLNLVGAKEAGVDSIAITAPEVNVTNFNRIGSISIGGFGDGSRITNNTIWVTSGSGITVDWHSTDNVITGNQIIIDVKFGGIGIHLESETNYVVDNVITDTGASYSTGIKVQGGYNNISYNTFYLLYTGIEYHGYNNVFHHNNYIQPEDWFYHISRLSYGTNIWDNGTAGNYWSDYDGRDVDGDGIGDTYLPHHEVDNYPLMKPWDKVPPKATKIEFRDSGLDLATNITIVEDSEVHMVGDGYDNTAITSYEWDFGDNTTTKKGSIPDIWSPVGGAYHTYSSPGIYIVTLTVWDLGGNNDTISTTITVLVDTDGDGTADIDDPDDDGDEVLDLEDAFPLDASEWLDTDGDGIGNNADTDDDNDGMPDTWENKYGLNLLDPSDASLDPDNDGLTNLEEYQGGTNPNVSNISIDGGKYLWWILIGIPLFGISLGAVLFWRHRVSKKTNRETRLRGLTSNFSV